MMVGADCSRSRSTKGYSWKKGASDIGMGNRGFHVMKLYRIWLTWIWRVFKCHVSGGTFQVSRFRGHV